MTKRELVKEIQKAEAKSFLELKQDEATFGEESPSAAISRIQWMAIWSLLRKLDINSNPSLPENIESTRMAIEKYGVLKSA